MMLTTVLAAANGVDAFSMVHDSYATHAADAGTLAYCIRYEFMRMYQEHDVLGTLRDNLRAQLSDENAEKLPEIPASGTLDLSAVLESDFFFA